MTKEERPWGSYEVINQGSRYKVKCIEVSAGESLSLQRHTHRAEHWVVVEGTALVEVDSKTKVLTFLLVSNIDYQILARYHLK